MEILEYKSLELLLKNQRIWFQNQAEVCPAREQK